jgi:hypothetical protein
VALDSIEPLLGALRSVEDVNGRSRGVFAAVQDALSAVPTGKRTS